MNINRKQMEAVLALPGDKRFADFIKVVADRQEVWGLYQDGWALVGADDGTTAFPLWPAKEFAQLCAANEWNGYESPSIPLSDLAELLLPKLEQDDVLPAVFLTPTSKGVTLPIEELQAAVEEELQNY